MRIAVATWLLALLPFVTVRAQPGAMNSPATAVQLFPLFMTGDLKDEFLTQNIDSRAVIWFETPVSIEGSRVLRQAAQQSAGRLVPVPLVLHREPGDNERMENRRNAWVWVVTNPIDANLAKTTHVLLHN